MSTTFNEAQALQHIRHFLPSQAPLKDFIHHNTLHAFMKESFWNANFIAENFFGYRTYPSLENYLSYYRKGIIRDEHISYAIRSMIQGADGEIWKQRMFNIEEPLKKTCNLGQLRRQFQTIYTIDPDDLINPLFFRIIAAFLDQGVAIYTNELRQNGLLNFVKEIENATPGTFFKSKRVRNFLNTEAPTIESILTILVGSSAYYLPYLFDTLFSHAGWSGMFSVLEKNPNHLILKLPIRFYEFVYVKLLFELNLVDIYIGNHFKPLGLTYKRSPPDYSFIHKETIYTKVIKLWQESLEWSTYQKALAEIKNNDAHLNYSEQYKVQALFCIDDRECSIRRHLEILSNSMVSTYSTAGFFGIPIYYKPLHSETLIQVCPAAIEPRHIVREMSKGEVHEKSSSLSKSSLGLLRGWINGQIHGFTSLIKLIDNIFNPHYNNVTNSSTHFHHRDAELDYLNIKNEQNSDGLNYGFKTEEMVSMVSDTLQSIGLTKNFSPLVYIIAHGATTSNNTHYAGYDCGACSGRPGIVNARVFALMANRADIREGLKSKGIHIPSETHFIAALHDTTHDQVIFYDSNLIPDKLVENHKWLKTLFNQALEKNALERSNYFQWDKKNMNDSEIIGKMRKRGYDLFEPRPELNHARNAYCIIGRRSQSEKIFLDRRSFLNSYDPEIDPDGHLLEGILSAVAPVCGGINLEYYYSKTDPDRLGAGTKLSHNVVGLFGVSNGVEGDLRTGLPIQMTELHIPVRLLMIIEQENKIIDKILQRNSKIADWFNREWIRLVTLNPSSRSFHLFAENIWHELDDSVFETGLPQTKQVVQKGQTSTLKTW